MTVGGRVFTDLTTIISLCGYCSSNRQFTLRKPGVGSGYAVTTGKTLTIHAAKISCTSPAGFYGFECVQSDNDIGVDSATAFTNPVYQFGAATPIMGLNTSSGASEMEYGQIAFPVSALKYPGIYTNVGNIQVYAWGYEA